MVSAAEEASLLCWTQFNCTEMYSVGSDSAIKCESTVSGHDFKGLPHFVAAVWLHVTDIHIMYIACYIYNFDAAVIELYCNFIIVKYRHCIAFGNILYWRTFSWLS